MNLVVAIPEHWKDASAAVAWALVRPDGTLEREGQGQIGSLPSARRTTVVVAASRVLLTRATLPSRGAHRVRSALAYAIEDQLTSDPESVHAVAAGAPRDKRQSIAVIEREWLRGLIASFRAAGVSPDSVTVETCLPPIVDGEWTLVLREENAFLRTGEASGMGLEGGFDGGVPDVLKLALDSARSARTAPRRIAVRADSPPDLRAWSRELGVPCEVVGSWQAWQLVGRSTVEFLQGEFARTSGLRALWPRLRPAGILAAAALTIEVAGTFCQWGALRYEKAQLEARMREQFMAAFPKAQAVVDPALQMQRNLQAARAAAGVAQNSDFLPLLARVATANPGAGWHVKTVGYEAGKLTLDLVVTDKAQTDSMLKRLADKDITVSIEAANRKSSETRFVFVPRAGQ
jgi:general secretion pathway protein L